METTNLVKGGVYVISELDFSYGSVTHECESDAKTRNSLFSQGGIEDAFLSC